MPEETAVAPYVYDSDKPKTAAHYRLLANPHRHYYTSRTKPILLAVNHITAGIDDYTPPDDSIEATVRYSAMTSVKASYHGGVDSDSIIDCLPDEYTAWAQGVPGYNFNSPALSLEIGKRSTNWTNAPDAWVEATLANAAKWWAPRVRRHKIPLRLLTDRDQIQRLINKNEPAGFTEHWRLDPANRSDAGRVGNGTTFPWARFFELVREELDLTATTQTTAQKEPLMVTPDDEKKIRQIIRDEVGKAVWEHRLPLNNADVAVLGGEWGKTKDIPAGRLIKSAWRMTADKATQQSILEAIRED